MSPNPKPTACEFRAWMSATNRGFFHTHTNIINKALYWNMTSAQQKMTRNCHTVYPNQFLPSKAFSRTVAPSTTKAAPSGLAGRAVWTAATRSLVKGRNRTCQVVCNRYGGVGGWLGKKSTGKSWVVHNGTTAIFLWHMKKQPKMDPKIDWDTFKPSKRVFLLQYSNLYSYTQYMIPGFLPQILVHRHLILPKHAKIGPEK